MMAVAACVRKTGRGTCRGMPIPVVIRCECGAETRGDAGETLVCEQCGRRYETAGVMSEQLLQARSAAVRHKVLARLGIGVVGLLTVLALFQFGMLGFVVTFAVTALLWFGVVMRIARKRAFGAILSAETTRIQAEE